MSELRKGWMDEWTQFSEKMDAVQSENEFLQSRVNALSDLEGAILEENQV